jgi:hypothetical protein
MSTRREVITLVGGAAAAWPLAAGAQQQSAKLPTIGVLGVSTPSNWTLWVAAFVQRLRELGLTKTWQGGPGSMTKAAAVATAQQ